MKSAAWAGALQGTLDNLLLVDSCEFAGSILQTGCRARGLFPCSLSELSRWKGVFAPSEMHAQGSLLPLLFPSQSFNTYFSNEHSRLLTLWRKVVGFRRHFSEMKTMTERSEQLLGREICLVLGPAGLFFFPSIAKDCATQNRVAYSVS